MPVGSFRQRQCIGKENLALWLGTGHLVEEPVLTVGGNGLGFLALLAVGVGFGVTRALRGRRDRGSREASGAGWVISLTRRRVRSLTPDMS
jgi:hypothetical protein